MALVLLLGLFVFDVTNISLKSDFALEDSQQEKGRAVTVGIRDIVFLPPFLSIPSDSSEGNLSAVRLFQNGEELRPHVLHSAIRDAKSEAGVFSHWGERLYLAQRPRQKGADGSFTLEYTYDIDWRAYALLGALSMWSFWTLFLKGLGWGGSLIGRIPSRTFQYSLFVTLLIATGGAGAATIISFPIEPVGFSRRVDAANFPVIYDGKSISVDFDIRDIGFFKPVFGGEREVVNPEKPLQDGARKLVFKTPGEYYLTFNDKKSLKVLVLKKTEPVRLSVTRVFDFFVANMIVTRGGDEAFYNNRNSYAKDWFRSSDPGMLLCGPTLDLFGTVIRSLFDLPIRDVTFTGTYLQNGKVRYITHNVLEVYLPDVKKWVLFDINNGFLAKWKGAFEISQAVRKKAGTGRRLSKEEWYELEAGLDLHEEVIAYRTIDAGNEETVFRKGLLTNIKVRDLRADLYAAFVGGASYWGGARFGVPRLPADYDVYYASLHEKPFLREASIRWQGNWNLSVKVVSPKKLKSMLDTAYEKDIREQKWLERIPKEKDADRITHLLQSAYF